MKLNINWKELAKQLLKAIGPVIAGALTGTTVVTATGSTSMATQPYEIKRIKQFDESSGSWETGILRT